MGDGWADWHSVSPGMYGAALSRTGQGKHFLVVERLPGGGWDWLTWQAADRKACLHGCAASQAAAMRAAELAAVHLQETAARARLGPTARR